MIVSKTSILELERLLNQCLWEEGQITEIEYQRVNQQIIEKIKKYQEENK